MQRGLRVYSSARIRVVVARVGDRCLKARSQRSPRGFTKYRDVSEIASHRCPHGYINIEYLVEGRVKRKKKIERENVRFRPVRKLDYS